MRKLIMMALAGYVWRKFQARNLQPSQARAPRRV